ncbi:MAG: hypothetical protein JWO09_617 [Bacteroidetes bacterium]|nr:hypothetical protein [Bacteroidota bacterium]
MHNKHRIKTLEELEVLDSLPEKEFNDIVDIASEICGTPISLITLLDSKRQWFKARKGVEEDETPIEHAFCAHAIQHPDEVMVVPDALNDERFANNPLVTGDQHIRFYAGAPLISAEGHALGTLCVLDSKPRTFTSEQARILKILAGKVIKLLESRKEGIIAKKQIALSENELRTTLARLLEAQHIAHIGSWEWDVEKNEYFSSPEMYNLFGLPRYEKIIMDSWEKLVHPEDLAGTKDNIARALKTGKLDPHEFRLIKPNGEMVWLLGMGTVAANAKGENTILKGTMLDITERKAAEENREQYIHALEEMLFALSHKVRRPVATILGLSSVFEHEQSVTEKVIAEYLLRFKTATEELDIYVRELTDFLHKKKTGIDTSTH